MTARFRREFTCPHCHKSGEWWVSVTEEQNEALLDADAKGGIKRVREVQRTIAAEAPHRCGT